MGGIPADRVVAVVADLDTGKKQIGSGYLLDAGRVLTARHCAYDKLTGRAAVALRIVRASDGDSAAVTVSAASPSLDVALLVVDGDLPWGAGPAFEPVAFGRVDRDRTGQLDDCEAVGYPLWQGSEAGDYRDLAELHGIIRAMEGRESQRLVLRDPQLTGVGWARGDGTAAGHSQQGEPSPWSGLSGAAVFHNRLLLGVIIEHHRRQGPNAVQIRPIEAVASAASAGEPDSAQLSAALGLDAAAAFRQVGAPPLDALLAQVTADDRIPAVVDCDPFEAGVVRTSHDNEGSWRYVVRDVDEAKVLESALRERRLVVVLGPSAAGKSCTALQAARTVLPGYMFLQPLPGAPLRSLLGRFGGQEVLVWLDDLDRYIDGSPGGLTVGLLNELATSRPGWRFLATLRTDRLESIMAEASDQARARALGQILAVGVVIPLERGLSNFERVRAEVAYPEEDFSGGVGLGERLIAGPELRNRLLGAANPLGAVLCRAAIDLQLMGLEPPFTRAELIRLAPAYMKHEHPDVPVGSFDFLAAFDWAMQPLVSHVSLMAADERSPDSVRVADYVTANDDEIKGKRWIPLQAWALAIERAEQFQVLRVIYSSHLAREWRACVAACDKALRTLTRMHHFIAWSLGRSQYYLKNYPAAIDALNFAATSEDETVSAHALETLAEAYYEQGQRDRAIDCLERAGATHHTHTVNFAAFRIALIREEQARNEHGEPRQAEADYDRAARIAAENADNQTADMAWRKIADLRQEAGDPSGAAEAVLKRAEFAESTQDRDALTMAAGSHFRDAARDNERARSCFMTVLERTDQPELIAQAALQIALLGPAAAVDPQNSEQVSHYFRVAVERGAGPSAQAAAVNLAAMLSDDADEKRTLLHSALSGPNPKLRAVAELALAQLELRLNNPAAVAAHLDTAFEGLRSTTDTQHLLALAETLDSAGQGARAHTVYGILRDIGNADEKLKASLNHAKWLLSSGQIEGAISQLGQLVADAAPGKGRDTVALELANALDGSGRQAEAIDVLEEAIGERSDALPSVRQHLGGAYHGQGQYGRALETVQPLIDSPDPADRAHGLMIAAKSHLSLGDAETAAEQFAAVVETGHAHSVARAHYELAHMYESQPGQEETVLAHCRSAMEMGYRPWALQAVGILVSTLTVMGRAAEAVAALTDYEPQVEPSMRAPYLLVLAQSLQADRKLARARLKFEEALRAAVDDGNSGLVTQAGDGLLSVIAANDWRDRVAVLETMYQHADKETRARAGYESAQQLAVNGQLDEARELLAAVIATDVQPYVDRAWVVMAEVMWLSGDAESAPGALVKSANSADQWVKDYRPLIEGEIQLGLGDTDGAVKSFQAALTSGIPNVVGGAQRLLGNLMDNLGRDTEAVSYLEQAAASEDHAIRHQARLDLAAHYADADPDMAIGMYRSLAEDPIGCLHTYAAALQAGVLLTDQGRYDDAKAVLKHALLSPYPLVAQGGAYQLSIAEIGLGEKQAAQHRLTALAETPGSQFIMEANFQLGDLDADNGDLEGAVRHFSDVRDGTDDDHPLHTLAALGAAMMLAKLERGGEAYPTLVELCDEEDPYISARAHLSLGYIHRSQDRIDLAAREFQAAIQAEPDGDTAAEARQALAALTD